VTTQTRLPQAVGVVAALVAIGFDQGSKQFLLQVLHLADHPIRLTPFFDLVLAWNIGISFGWLQNDSQLVQAALMAVKLGAVVALAYWMIRVRTVIASLALGLIIGGAIGNAIDRLVYGAVVDFAHFHLQIGEKIFSWYVFNLADVAIVLGVLALLYDSFWGGAEAKDQSEDGAADPGRPAP